MIYFSGCWQWSGCQFETFLKCLTRNCSRLSEITSVSQLSIPYNKICFGLWSFTSRQNLRSYQDGYRLMTMRTHGDFISAAPLGDQANSTMTWYPTQSHYFDTEPTSPCLILIMPSTWLGSNECKILSHWFYLTSVRIYEVLISQSPKTRTRRSTHLAIQSDHYKGSLILI